MGAAHDRETLREFLQDDPRQVWARDRATGTPVYIEVGTAEAVRDQAKAQWKCIVPDCHAPITTSGGTRRDHFKHVGTSPHGSGGESQHHLAAKAMIANWAANWADRHLTGGASVREEHTVKDPTTAMHRIADVMVTWANGNHTAFEVEYKPYAVADWAKKHGEYTAKNIPCAWLLGHTKVRARKKPEWETGDWSHAVKVPELGIAIGRAGRHILVVNPLSKYIGTIAGNQQFTMPLRDTDCGEGWLALDHIETCTLDRERGIVTPTMRRIDEAEESRRAAAALEKARLQAEEEAEQARRAAKHERDLLFERLNEHRWQTSPLRAIARSRWDDQVPEVLFDGNGPWWWIHASPLHWQLAIYEECLHNRPAGENFTINDCWAALNKHRIQANTDYRNRFKALIAFLEALQKFGLVTIVRQQGENRITHINISASIEDVQRRQAERQRERAARHTQQAEQRQTNALRQQQRAATRKERAALLKADAERDWAAHRERIADIDRLKAEQQQRWLESDILQQVIQAHEGETPKAIAWPGGGFLTAIDAAPAHWHAHIYMTHIYNKPPGTRVDMKTARITLQDANIALPGVPATVLSAIDDYLYNLLQRGILERPAGSQDAYAVRTITP